TRGGSLSGIEAAVEELAQLIPVASVRSYLNPHLTLQAPSDGVQCSHIASIVRRFVFRTTLRRSLN
ncbi:hypothetical protein, partial [Pseudomonas savastanoi]|uniref:hypothetical protein n=1 Tax=Pseudomonas savastanoi TaxID=29438 RepID=UPI001F336CC0